MNRRAIEQKRIIERARRKILNIEKTINKGPFKDILYKDIALWHRTSGVIDGYMDQDRNTIVGEHYVNNLTDLPDPTLHPNKVIYVLNFGIGGSPWLSNGVIWVPASNRIIVANFYNPSVLGGTVTNEQIMRQVVFPLIPNQGNVIRIGDVLCLSFDNRKTGTVNTFTAGTRFGISGTLTDNFFETPSASSNTIIGSSQRHYFCRIDANNIKKLGIAGSVTFAGVTSTGDGGNLNITTMDTNSLYLSYTSKMNGNTDTFTQRTLMVELFSSGVAS